jgi:hypothetical protein
VATQKERKQEWKKEREQKRTENMHCLGTVKQVWAYVA